MFGQLVTFTATVAAVPPGAGIPTGTVTFASAGGPTLTGTLNASGQASVTTNALTVGSHLVTATYNGDTNFTGSSATLTQVVNSSFVNTSLTATPATIRVRFSGQLFIPTLSATLVNMATSAGIPGQTITFIANPLTGPVTLGTAVTDASGIATLRVPNKMITCIS
ncbi:Ig-like domain-containing protein [Saccharopolyspora shandongensis]